MKRIVVCDDNAESITHIKSLLKQYITEKNKEAEILYYSSGKKMLEDDAILQKGYETDNTPLNNRKKIDIAILDVEMDRLSGIQTGYEIQKRYPDAVLIITTAYMRYLDDAMDLKVFRYFEKPVDKERLFTALDISLKEKEIIDVSTPDGTIRLSESEIVCIYAHLRKTTILTDKGKQIKTDLNIKEWLKKTEKNTTFASPHYSYIVNLKYVSKCSTGLVEVQCKNGEVMKIYPSKRKYSEFKSKFFNKMREYK